LRIFKDIPARTVSEPHIHLVPRLRMRGALPILLSMSSLRGS